MLTPARFAITALHAYGEEHVVVQPRKLEVDLLLLCGHDRGMALGMPLESWVGVILEELVIDEIHRIAHAL